MAFKTDPFKSKSIEKTYGVDVSDTARNWITNYSGTYIAPSASSKAMTQIMEDINGCSDHLRTIFTKSGILKTTSAGYDILDMYDDQTYKYAHNFLYPDYGPNITDIVIDSVFHKESTPNEKYTGKSEVIHTLGIGIPGSNLSFVSIADKTRTKDDANYRNFSVERNSLTNSMEGQSIWVGTWVPKLTTQDFYFENNTHHFIVKEKEIIDTPALSICSTGNIKASKPILGNYHLEDARSVFHDTRTKRLPILLSYSVAGTEAYHLTTDSTTYVNILDTSVTARDENSPGFSSVVYLCGVGPEDESAGQIVNVEVRAFCSGYGDIAFIGPNDTATIAVDRDYSSNAWGWSVGAAYLTLNSQSDYDDTTTARNKIDIHFKADSGQDIYVRALHARVIYS